MTDSPPAVPAVAPHKGAQSAFLSSSADLALYGGGKGGGKTRALLMEAVRWVKNPRYGAVIFRRTYSDIFAQGGLWSSSIELYPLIGGVPKVGDAEWVFPGGAHVQFRHLENESDKLKWAGVQLPTICFDELTTFTHSQFWYLVGCNRSTCGVRPKLRATCNPDADSWVAKLVDWWIGEDGYPIQDRSGIVRWVMMIDEKMEWGSSWGEMHERYPETIAPPGKSPDGMIEKRIRPLSFTYIPAKLDDNPTLQKNDPDYRSKLMLQPQVERERLLYGNWRIRQAAGLLFPRDKWKLVDAAPDGLRLLRFWDKAYTEGGTGARTAGVLVGELSAEKARDLHLPRFYIVHAEAGRWGEAEREGKIRSLAELDRADHGYVRIGVEQEGGAGKQASYVTAQNLQGFDVYIEHPTAKKHIRWRPLAAQQQVGNVAVVRGAWDWADFIRELDALAGDELLDKGKLRDMADAAAGAFKGLIGGGAGVYGELITSGDPTEDDRTPLTKEELDDAPEFLKELLGSYREDQPERDDDLPFPSRPYDKYGR